MHGSHTIAHTASLADLVGDFLPERKERTHANRRYSLPGEVNEPPPNEAFTQVPETESRVAVSRLYFKPRYRLLSLPFAVTSSSDRTVAIQGGGL